MTAALATRRRPGDGTGLRVASALAGSILLLAPGIGSAAAEDACGAGGLRHLLAPGRAVFLGGTAWTCTTADPASCGARSLGGSEPAEAGRVELYDERKDGHDGSFALPSMTASPPAARGPSPP